MSGREFPLFGANADVLNPVKGFALEIKALSFDFADTLFPHRSRELSRILDASVDFLRPHIAPFEMADFEAKFLEIRDRQFAENRESLRENDFAARWREAIQHVTDGSLPDPELVEGCLGAYSDAFVEVMRMPNYLPELFATLSRDYRLCVISNYPLSAPILRTLESAGLTPFLDGIIVSADLGVIKPHPALFEAARTALGHPAAEEIVHIGDDWDADIIGASRAGFRMIYTGEWRDSTDRHYGTGNARPLAEIGDLRELPDLLQRLRANP